MRRHNDITYIGKSSKAAVSKIKIFNLYGGRNGFEKLLYRKKRRRAAR